MKPRRCVYLVAIAVAISALGYAFARQQSGDADPIERLKRTLADQLTDSALIEVHWIASDSEPEMRRGHTSLCDDFTSITPNKVDFLFADGIFKDGSRADNRLAFIVGYLLAFVICAWAVRYLTSQLRAMIKSGTAVDQTLSVVSRDDAPGMFWFQVGGLAFLIGVSALAGASAIVTLIHRLIAAS